MGFGANWLSGTVTLAAGLVIATPSLAQDSGETALDRLSEASSSANGAIEQARRQEADGNPLGAAATLERLLLVQSGADDARLAYIALLCRLDDRQAAQLELGTLAGRGGSRAAWAEAERACGPGFARPKSPGYFRGEVAAGLAYDSDALGSLVIQRAGFALADEGLAAVVTAQLHGRAALGGAFLYGDAFGLTHDDIDGPNIDYQFGDAAVGLGHEIGTGEISLGGVVRYGRIADRRYLTEYGGEARLSFPAGDTGRMTLRAQAVKQDFAVPTSDSWDYATSFTYSDRPNDRFTWFLSATGEVKSAKTATEEYHAARLSGGVAWRLDPHGTYLALNSTVRYVDFGEAAFFPERSEWRFYNRAALGYPLGQSGLALEAAVTHSYRNYNAASLIDDYSSFGGELRLVWKFGQGRTAP